MDKNKKKELLKKYAQEQKKNFLHSLPFNTMLFQNLFDYLDDKLGEDGCGCDDTLKYTIKFLENNNLPKENSLDWMSENGGYCDCEVLANIEGKMDGM
ncbi:DUF2695 domain-containing protein [Clostridium estertheticum]|uniref:DUF2695 domain-containing protein n=1 Tax=Clostridium estertheticum TaxID=238834 RepID=UPI0013E98ECC|nr:DUF2695 domain-containing protein [Clostridium estertheticum]MBZ9685921.1 DUF2695 domain-containing protein [Clostridium estertheticum]